jgi:hypothetical protein
MKQDRQALLKKDEERATLMRDLTAQLKQAQTIDDLRPIISWLIARVATIK